MPKNGKYKTKNQAEQRFGDSMVDEVILIIIVGICIVVLISLLTRKMGILGGVLGDTLKGLLGISSILFPLSAIAYCSWMLGSERKKNREVRMIGIALLLITISALAHIINPIETSIMDSFAEKLHSYYQEGAFNNGGLFGGVLGGSIMKAFGKIGAGILWTAILLVSVIMTTGKSLFKEVNNVKSKSKQYREKRIKKEVHIQEVPKKQPRIQEVPKKQARIQEMPRRRATKPKPNMKKKKQPKSDFNILLSANEGYNQNKQEIPVVQETIFKPKPMEQTPTGQIPKVPVIFDYGREEIEQPVTEQLEQLPSEAELEAQRLEKEEQRRQKLEKEKLRELERKKQRALERQKQIELLRQQELEKLQKKKQEQENNNVAEKEEEKPSKRQESDTEDIADVLALLNSIHFEEEETEEEPEEQKDIMEIIEDWAEETEEKKGLTLFLAEEDEEKKTKQIEQDEEEQSEKKIEKPQEIVQEPQKIQEEIKEIEQIKKQEYMFPPFDLLSKKEAIQSNESKSEMLVNAKKLEATLKSFGVDAKVVQINKGPTVTRYELSPSQGVKVSKIVNLADDIALNLAASGIRMEAPIPGKAAVGIEVPNKQTQSVSLRSVLESETFQKFDSKLAFALGEDITGQPVVTDITKMPHLLIAGATGSGKSVCINTLITSILYKAKPEEVKLLLVDPKVVELSIYNGIPHLLIPVVTDPKKAAAALNWAVREMLARYQDFAENGVRDIKGYNAMKQEKEENDLMPQMVIIIDELADLMMAAPGEVEDSICRLAQMARAAGMHLIIATQRPSVDVITGVIKANIPSRLAFAVSSGIDSRTILDMTGAEKLLGKGDMLFYPQGTSKPVRIQGAFLSDKEVESIVRFVKKDGVTGYDNEMIDKITSTEKTEIESTDEFFDSAVEFVIQKQKASTSMLQRQFRIGYNRAARLMESLEKNGIVGQEEGSKPRKVLLTKQQWEERKNTE